MAFGTRSVMNEAPPPPPHAPPPPPHAPPHAPPPPPHAPPPSAQRKKTAIVGRMHVDGPPSRRDDVVVTLAPATPAHSAGAVNSTADVLDLMQDDDDDERYTPVTVTESPAATIPAEPSAGMMDKQDNNRPSTAMNGKMARSFRSFEGARAYVHTLGLKGVKKWEAWSSSGKRPWDIPSAPNKAYKSSGWLSFGDFLGYAEGKVARLQGGSFRSFEDARAYVRTLGLKSKKKWQAWSASSKRPCDIPSNPHQTYASSGWLSFGDFLGYAEGKAARLQGGSFRSFEDARAYVRTLGLKSKKKWQAWSASSKRPCDIPSTPHVTYASSGWTSYGDFLGFAGGKVTGAYKRNAAAAGLRALLDGADNDEKGEQDGDDEDARRRKQAKRPRGG